MSRYKSRSPATDEYYSALGQANFAFSTLEWTLVCIARKIKDDFITPAFYKNWTSGTVKREFKELIDGKKDDLGELYEKLTDHNEKFGELILRRNGIAHSQPITGPDGSAMLSRYEFVGSFHWTIESLDSFAKDTDEIAMSANHILHYEML